MTAFIEPGFTFDIFAFNFFKPGFHMIVRIVAIAENGCDDPDDRMETPISFLVTIVTIRTATIVKIETSSVSTIVAIK